MYYENSEDLAYQPKFDLLQYGNPHHSAGAIMQMDVVPPEPGYTYAQYQAAWKSFIVKPSLNRVTNTKTGQHVDFDTEAIFRHLYAGSLDYYGRIKDNLTVGQLRD